MCEQLFKSRGCQLLTFLLWIVLFSSVYVFVGDLKFDEAFRYLFDVGFNIGTGTGNIAEKDDVVTFVTVIVMLTGYFLVALFWTDFIAFILGQEESIHMEMFKDLFQTGRKGARKVQMLLGCFTPSSLAYTLMLLWLILGVLIGVYVEEYNFVYALNYAVGLCTSTGSQQPKNEPLNNYIAAVYMLFGIPLTAMTVAIFIDSMPKKQYKAVGNSERMDL